MNAELSPRGIRQLLAAYEYHLTHTDAGATSRGDYHSHILKGMNEALASVGLECVTEPGERSVVDVKKGDVVSVWLVRLRRPGT
jgi:hypothetical protein